MTPQIDMYTGIHKGQRRRFSNISFQAGTLDSTDQKSLDKLFDEFNSFREHMRLHARLEETFIHTLLSQRVPGGARQLEEDHRIMHQKFDDLVTHFDGIRAKPADFEKRRELTLEFYRAWSRFIAFYFTHINKEEEEIMPTLWKLCTNEELADTFKMIMANQKQEELVVNLEMMLPAMNLQERAEMLGAGRAMMPPEAFQGFLKLAQRILEPNDWTALKTKFGVT